MIEKKQPNLLTVFLVFLLVAVPATIFWPGTSGDFLFDDYGSLSGLKLLESGYTLDALRHYIFSGVSGPTGRPLSLFTFTFDGQTWPAEPLPFKITNILIHIVNGIILFGLVFSLLRIINKTQRYSLITAFTVAIIWLVHPLQTSTVLYIVQRMTELSTLFIFLGLWSYLYGRKHLIDSPGPAYLGMSAGIIIFGTLSVLSKENGALLPLLILITEFTLLNSLPRPRHWYYWAVPMLVIPTVLLIAYFIYVISGPTAYENRDFTLYERVLTQSRVLIDYLFNIIFPINTPSLHHDDFVISKSLFNPISTLFASLTIIALITAAFYYRKKLPITSFGILWFFGAHLMESSILPLELYFEHRNYLPMAGLFLAIILLCENFFSTQRNLFLATAAAIIVVASSATFYYSTIWGDKNVLADTWIEEHPESIRSDILYSMRLFIRERFDEALSHSYKTYQKYPNLLSTHLNYVGTACSLNKLTEDEFVQLLRAASVNRFRYDAMNHLHLLLKSCPQLSGKAFHTLLNELLKNKWAHQSKYLMSDLYLMKKDIYVKERDIKGVLDTTAKALFYEPDVNVALLQVKYLILAKSYSAAEVYLAKAEILDELRSPLLPSRKEQIDSYKSTIKEKWLEESSS